jgi:hypothetical protein
MVPCLGCKSVTLLAIINKLLSFFKVTAIFDGSIFGSIFGAKAGA